MARPNDELSSRPAYLRVADAIRSRIERGVYSANELIPSRPQLCKEFQVGDRVVMDAIGQLELEGRVVPKSGAGTYARPPREVRVLYQTWDGENDPSHPQADIPRRLRIGKEQCETRYVQATEEIANRLQIDSGTQVVQSTYTSSADGEAVMYTISHELLGLVAGTSEVLPARGAGSGMGVIDRMSLLNTNFTRFTERVTARQARSPEHLELGISIKAIVMVTRRTYYAVHAAVEGEEPTERPVIISDSVFPVDRCEPEYLVPNPRYTGNAGPSESAGDDSA